MRHYVVALSLFLGVVFSSNAQQLVFSGKARDDYFTQIFTHALSYSTENKYQLTFHGQDIPKVRVFNLIAQHQGIDVIPAGATREREIMLRPIRIPLLRGLHGWRIPLVTKENKDLFANIKDKSEFLKLTTGQLHTWSDTEILKRNGIVVEKGTNYQGLFDMLAGGRFDYFPRAIIEIDRELESHSYLPIEKDNYVLIHYPTAYYFYVAKDNHQLAVDLELGLEKAIADGSFKHIFNQHYGDVVKKVRAEKRRIISLNNPTLPDETPLWRKSLWLDFSQ